MKVKIYVGALLSCLLFLILYSNIIALSHNCLDAYDFGLYYQAIVNFSLNDINPYLSIRTLNIFNDHFEPVLILVSLISKIFFDSPYFLVFFEWMSFVGFIIALIYLNDHKDKTFFWILLFTVLSRGILSGLVFPVHPNTWSMLLWPFIVYFLYKQKFVKLCLALFFLGFFRESNTLAIPLISLFFFVNKKYKEGFILFFVTGFMTFMAFKGRILLFGDAFDYGSFFSDGLMNHPFSFIVTQFKNISLKGFLKVFIPLLLPILFLIKTEITSFKNFLKHPFFAVCLFVLPLFFLHTLANKIGYHYGVTFIAPLLSLFILSPSFNKFIQNKKIMTITISLFVVTSSSQYTKFFKLGVLEKSKKCVINSTKHKSTLRLQDYIDKNIELDKTLFSSRRVVPMILKKGLKVYVPNFFSKPLLSYDFLLMEKDFRGGGQSLTKPRYEKMKKLCATDGTQVLIDNEFYYLLKGPITSSCSSYFSFMF